MMILLTAGLIKKTSYKMVNRFFPPYPIKNIKVDLDLTGYATKKRTRLYNSC